jgi:hypothetical protein
VCRFGMVEVRFTGAVFELDGCIIVMLTFYGLALHGMCYGR